jgi:hypothetical protein
MDKMDHLMAEKNKNNKDSQKRQVTPKKYFKKDKTHKNIIKNNMSIFAIKINFFHKAPFKK